VTGLFFKVAQIVAKPIFCIINTYLVPWEKSSPKIRATFVIFKNFPE
jgi:hypothetical protein